MNYVRVDDRPIVFQRLLPTNATTATSATTTAATTVEDGTKSLGALADAAVHTACEMEYGGGLRTPFDPATLIMDPGTLRLYHPASLGDTGLVASALAIELGRFMDFPDSPDSDDFSTPTLLWQGKRYPVRDSYEPC